MRGQSALAVQLPLILCFLLISAFSLPWKVFSLPENGSHGAHSERAGAVTNQGVQGTVSGGSSQNPQINDLITIQNMAEMQADLKQLNRLLKELGMTFYLEQSRDMTMFMPIDSAFSQLPFNIHELSWQAKWRIVQFHIIPNDVIDLDNALRDKTEKEFESWEGAPLKVTKVTPERQGAGVASVEYIVDKDAKIISKPPKIETFNGASYKINKVLLPPSMTEEDFKPARLEQRINPDVSQRLRRHPAAEVTPSLANEQQLASIDGTVQMERSVTDPRLPGSFRPDPLAQRSQVTPEFLRGVNSQHARWDDTVYHRTPQTQQRDQKKPQDEIFGFQHDTEEARNAEARIKVLAKGDNKVVPTNGEQPAMTLINNSGPRPSSIGLAFESAENPESAPSDPLSQFVNVLLGGRSPQSASHPASPASQPAIQPASQPASQSSGEESLFSLPMTATSPPKVKTLGLTEGLLPSEELITHHWSGGSKTPQTSRRPPQQQQQEGASPLAALWQQIHRTP